MGTKVLQAALALHDKVAATFRKTAINFHYEFTVRHLAQVVGGLLQARVSVANCCSVVCYTRLHPGWPRALSEAKPAGGALAARERTGLCRPPCQRIGVFWISTIKALDVNNTCPHVQDLATYCKTAAAIAKKHVPFLPVDDLYPPKDGKAASCRALLFSHLPNAKAGGTAEATSQYMAIDNIKDLARDMQHVRSTHDVAELPTHHRR